MKPLATNRQYLIWLCACPANDESSPKRWQKLTHIIFAITILSGLISQFVSCFAYFWTFLSIDKGPTLYAFTFMFGNVAVFYMAVVGMTMLRHKIGQIFDDLTTIYAAHENTDSYRFLIRVNDRSEWMWKIYLKLMTFVITMNVVVATLVPIFVDWVINKHLNVENAKHPLPFVLPWNQTTPVGYFEELAFSYPVSYTFFFPNGAFLLLFISICQHHQAFYKMFKHSVNKLERSDENQCDAMFLRDLIGFYISIKDWFALTAEVYSSFIAIQLFCYEAMLAVSFFYVDYQIQQHNLDLVMAITTVLVGLSNLLIYCYLGKSTVESYAELSDCVYFTIKWYKLPIGLQKYLILMIENMQEPLYYHGFGVIDLNLETFTKLLKSAINYYMAIKAMTLE